MIPHPNPRAPRPSLLALGLVLALFAAQPAQLRGQSLRGSPASLDRQNEAAREHDFSFLRDAAQVRRFAEQGLLIPIRADRDIALHGVSFPYARPEVDVFLQRLAAQYRSSCGEQLVVTSLTRPVDRQPRNASERSVHPTGMAIDLRYPRDRGCRVWLERVLLSLEEEGVLEATLERRPLHYHVALFPKHYAAYLAQVESREAVQFADRVTYRVRSGDSLWTIARAHGTTVDRIVEANGLSGNRIFAGQVIDVPKGS